MWFQKPPLGTPLDWGNPLNDETTLHLAMNEGGGDKLQDLSMNGNHGTLNNFSFPPAATSGWRPGQTGVVLRFDSANDYIDCGTNPECMIHGPTTFSTIIRAIDEDNQPLVHWKSASTAPAIYLRLVGTNPIIYLGGSNYRYFIGNSLASDEDWHVVTAVITGIAQTDIRDSRFFIDGIELPSGTTISSGAVTAPNATLLGGGHDHDYGGYMDQTRINNKIWTTKEVRDYAINPWGVYLDE